MTCRRFYNPHHAFMLNPIGKAFDTYAKSIQRIHLCAFIFACSCTLKILCHSRGFVPLAQVGDILISVDGQFVQGMPLSALRPMILGPKGTFVKLGMKRYLPGEEARTEYTEFTIDLVRGDSMFFCENQHFTTCHDSVTSTPSTERLFKCS